MAAIAPVIISRDPIRGVGNLQVGRTGDIEVAPIRTIREGLFTPDQLQREIIKLLTTLPQAYRKPIGWLREDRNEKEDTSPNNDWGPSFTEDEARQLSQLRLDNNFILFDPTNSELLYQLVTLTLMLRDGRNSVMDSPQDPHREETTNERGNGFQFVMKYFQSHKWIIGVEAVHDSPLLVETRNAVEAAILNEEIEPIVEEGNIVCVAPGCRSRRILRNFAQTRSADEPFTGFFLCTECGKNWTQK